MPGEGEEWSAVLRRECQRKRTSSCRHMVSTNLNTTDDLSLLVTRVSSTITSINWPYALFSGQVMRDFSCVMGLKCGCHTLMRVTWQDSKTFVMQWACVDAPCTCLQPIR